LLDLQDEQYKYRCIIAAVTPLCILSYCRLNDTKITVIGSFYVDLLGPAGFAGDYTK